MAVVGNTYLTLADLFSRQDETKAIATIIEMLAEINPLLEDMPVVECNSGTRHLTTVRTGLPSATWRKLYEGVQPSKSTTRQVYDTVGSLEAWSEIDAKLVEISSDPAGTRLSEAQAFIEALSQTMATTLFYGDTASEPEKFLGLAPRFNDTGAENGSQIVKAGGAGSDNTSIWFVVWGERTVHGLYPRGSRAGLQRDDKGKQTKDQADGSVFDVFREKFCWDMGLSLRDWRYVARVCNVDVTALSSDASTGADLHERMTEAYYRLHQRRIAGGRAAIYCNTRIKEFLHKQALKANNNTFVRLAEVDGEEKMSFLGLPIRECDAILNTEAAVA